MRTLTAQQSRLYGLTRRQVQSRVWVKDAAGSWVNLCNYLERNWVVGVEYGEDVDSPGLDATITLRRDDHRLSLAPFRTGSRPNVSGALLALNRAIYIEAAITPENVAPTSADWTEVFRGTLTAIDSATPEVTLTAIGQQGELLWTFIEAVATYSDATTPEAMESVMQEILDDNLDTPPTLYVPVSSGATLGLFQSEHQSIWDELKKLVDLIGWNLRYKYLDGTGWRLTLDEPVRSGGTSLYTFAPTFWLDVARLEETTDDLRNVCAVTWADSTTLDASGQPTPATYTAENTSSIALYGRRWMGITYDATSLIDSAAEAQRLAEAAVSDLGFPKAVFEVELPFIHFAEVGDIYTFAADGQRLDGDLTTAVVGVRHEISRGKARTTLTCRGDASAVSSITGWLEKEGRAGVGPLVQDFPPLEVGSILGSGPVVRGIDGWGVSIDTSLIDITRKGSSMVELHLGALDFVPDLARNSTTYVGRWLAAGTLNIPCDTSRFPIGESWQAVLYAVNLQGFRTEGYRVSLSTNRTGLQFLAPEVRIAGSFRGSLFNQQSRGANFPPDAWSMHAGTWLTDAQLDDGSLYDAPLSGSKGLWLVGSGEVTLRSDKHTVAGTRRYRSRITHRTRGTSPGLTVSLRWLDASETLIISETLLAAPAATASAEWATLQRTHAPPANARFVQVELVKASGSGFQVGFDTVQLEEDGEREDAPKRVVLAEDFVGDDGAAQLGSLPWKSYPFTVDGSPTLTVSKATPSAAGWGMVGVLRLSSSVVNGGGVVALGSASSPMALGPPPTGLEVHHRVRCATTSAMAAWIGLWSHETLGPDPTLANAVYGIGIVARSGLWYGVVRWAGSVSVVETQVSLGVNADSTWRRLGWISTAAGIVFTVDGQDATSPQDASGLALDVPLSPMAGLISLAASEKALEVDTFFLHTLTDR